MPEVKIGGKVVHFPYTKKGRKAATRARKSKNYSPNVLKMARGLTK